MKSSHIYRINIYTFPSELRNHNFNKIQFFLILVASGLNNAL